MGTIHGPFLSEGDVTGRTDLSGDPGRGVGRTRRGGLGQENQVQGLTEPHGSRTLGSPLGSVGPQRSRPCPGLYHHTRTPETSRRDSGFGSRWERDDGRVRRTVTNTDSCTSCRETCGRTPTHRVGTENVPEPLPPGQTHDPLSRFGRFGGGTEPVVSGPLSSVHIPPPEAQVGQLDGKPGVTYFQGDEVP